MKATRTEKCSRIFPNCGPLVFCYDNSHLDRCWVRVVHLGWSTSHVISGPLSLGPAQTKPAWEFKKIDILLPHNQRPHRTLHVQKDVLPYALY